MPSGKKLGASIPVQAYRALEILAEESGKTVNYLISLAVVEHVKKNGFSVEEPRCCKRSRQQAQKTEPPAA